MAAETGAAPTACHPCPARSRRARRGPFAWCIYPWLEGETATVERIADLGRAATDVAQFVAALEGIDPTDGPPPGEHNSFRGVPLATRDGSTRAAITSLGDIRAALSVDEATWARGRGWALSQALIALSYYTLETNPVLVREAQRWMKEVLTDHAPTSS